MATPTQPQKPSTGSNAKRGPGRPPAADSRPRDVAALEALQNRLDRCTALINDNPSTSVAASIVRAARAGVPKATALKALGGIEATVADLRETLDRVYAAPAAKAPVKQRVSLV
jgi:hypothetical protein